MCVCVCVCVCARTHAKHVTLDQVNVSSLADCESFVCDSAFSNERLSTDCVDGHRVANVRNQQLEDGMNTSEVAIQRHSKWFHNQMRH